MPHESTRTAHIDARIAPGAIKSDAHELGNASNYAGSARLALLDHPNARQALHSRITFNRTLLPLRCLPLWALVIVQPAYTRILC